MKILAQPIDAVAVFAREKPPMPYKFKYVHGDEKCEIRVDKVLHIENRRIAGIPAIVYSCQSVVDGLEKRYELKYLPSSCRWELYKM